MDSSNYEDLDSDSSNEKKKGLSKGALIGIIVGVVAAVIVIVIVIIIVIIVRRKRYKASTGGAISANDEGKENDDADAYGMNNSDGL